MQCLVSETELLWGLAKLLLVSEVDDGDDDDDNAAQ